MKQQNWTRLSTPIEQWNQAMSENQSIKSNNKTEKQYWAKRLSEEIQQQNWPIKWSNKIKRRNRALK